MKRILAVAVFAVCLIPFAASAQVCEQVDCGQSDGPHTPYERGYSEFITLAYQGAYNRTATCSELRAEYTRLVNAAANGTIHAEAQRFVATLFMTQASYDAQDLTTYVQTATYEARNPLAYSDRTHLESFIGDLYRAFLQREPDAGGQCFWTNDACGNTTPEAARKHPIRAFQESIEFGALVDLLYDDGLPEACTCPRGNCL